MFADFKKKLWIFQNLMTFEYCWRQTFEILIIRKHSLGHVKYVPDRFNRFGVYWIKTNKKKNRQAKYLYINMSMVDINCYVNCIF